MTAVPGSLSGSEFQLSTEALLPLNVMLFLATRPIANLERRRSLTSMVLLTVRVSLGRVMVDWAPAVGWLLAGGS